MSKKRPSSDPDAAVLVRTYAVTHSADVGLPWRRFDRWDQLAYASRGVMNVWTSEGAWVVPPHRAVWIPAGVGHRVQMTGRVEVRTAYFARSLTARRMPRGCQAVNVSALLRELVLYATRIGTLRRDVPRHARLARVIVDELDTLPLAPLRLPMPVDPRARRCAEAVIASPGSTPTAALCRATGATRRTLERVFAAETGMTLGRWRRRARLIDALQRLARGEPVTTVALEVGYNGPSAFIAAFRADLGVTPRRYFQGPSLSGTGFRGHANELMPR